MRSILARFYLSHLDEWRGTHPCSPPRPCLSGWARPPRWSSLTVLTRAVLLTCPVSSQLLLGSGVGTVRLYDTEAKKNLCEININEDMPR